MSKEANALAKLIAEYVPPFVLFELNDPDVMLDVKNWRNELTGHKAQKLELAQRIVDAFEARGLISSLANTLYRKMGSDDLVAAKFVPFAKDGTQDNQQAALAYRALMLQQSKLREFLVECEPRICMVFAPGPQGTASLGTGFLIGPDCILTARHVVDFGIRGPGGGIYERYCAVFDHVTGPALNNIKDIPATARKVMFAPNWQELLQARDVMPNDGGIANPNAEQIEQLKKNLDFAVIKLAEPVGSESRYNNGGSRRGWFSASAFTGPDLDQRIIIPQHPMGFRQQIDFGRFKEKCPSETRIRYDTETAKGTSGAPCFNEKFELVGMHNAAYRPDGLDKWNQAIRFDWIAPLLPPIDNSTPKPVAAQIWSASQTGSKPIFGRRLLIEWIDRAMSVTAPVVDQIFAAEGKIGKSGRAFSVEILREKLSVRSDPVVELGTALAPLPTTVEDIMATIVDQLALPPSVLADMPVRPDKNAIDGSKKTATWASKEVPDWFERVLADNRQFGVSLLDYVRQLQEYGQAAFDASATDDERAQGRKFELTPEQQQILATEDGGIESRSRWQLIWVVLRLRTGQKLTEELSNLLARLARTVEGGTSELGRIRWLFIETIPDFIAILDPRSKEVLNPAEIGETELRNCWRGIANAANYPFNENDPNVVGSLNFFKKLDKLVQTEQRLPIFQQYMFEIATAFRATVSANRSAGV